MRTLVQRKIIPPGRDENGPRKPALATEGCPARETLPGGHGMHGGPQERGQITTKPRPCRAPTDTGSNSDSSIRRLQHVDRNLEGGRGRGESGGKGEGSRQHDRRNQHRWVDEERGLMGQSKCWSVSFRSFSDEQGFPQASAFSTSQTEVARRTAPEPSESRCDTGPDRPEAGRKRPPPRMAARNVDIAAHTGTAQASPWTARPAVGEKGPGRHPGRLQVTCGGEGHQPRPAPGHGFRPGCPAGRNRRPRPPPSPGRGGSRAGSTTR